CRRNGSPCPRPAGYPGKEGPLATGRHGQREAPIASPSGPIDDAAWCPRRPADEVAESLIALVVVAVRVAVALFGVTSPPDPTWMGGFYFGALPTGRVGGLPLSLTMNTRSFADLVVLAFDDVRCTSGGLS